MGFLVLNNARTTLSGSVSIGNTSLPVADGSGFAVGSDYSYITLENNAGQIETVKLTSRSGGTLTIASPGVVYNWASGTIVECRPCSQAVAAIVEDTIHDASAETTIADGDESAIVDISASNVLKKITWANVKATLKTYFDTLYPVYSSSAPSAPSNGQMWFNTTLKQMFYYDSTIDSGSWLSVEVFRSMPYSANVSTTNNPFWTTLQAMNSSDFDVYIEDMVGSTLIATTNDGSNYWNCFLSRRSSANADTAIANFTTASDTVATYTLHKQSVAVFIDVSAVDAKALLLTTTKTGSPGSITGSFGFNYRLVIPK